MTEHHQQRLTGPPLVAPAGNDRALIELRNVTRVWGSGASRQTALHDVSLDIDRGQLVALVGPSGSGKSTLGGLIAGIDQPTSGSIVIDGRRIDRLRASQLAAWRARHLGIVFQDFHLLPTLTAEENVEIALQFAGVRRGRSRSRTAAAALAAVGLETKRTRLPAQLSGGEQQRVAIARAIVRRPLLLVADEPTGSLDQASGTAVFDLLRGLATQGTTVVFITHDHDLADAADRTIELVDGNIVDQHQDQDQDHGHGNGHGHRCVHGCVRGNEQHSHQQHPDQQDERHPGGERRAEMATATGVGADR